MGDDDVASSAPGRSAWANVIAMYSASWIEGHGDCWSDGSNAPLLATKLATSDVEMILRKYTICAPAMPDKL
jgi:hypothetical protein